MNTRKPASALDRTSAGAGFSVVGAEGFEPTTRGLRIRSTDKQNRAFSRATDRKLTELTAEDPDLADVVKAWPKLPDALKAGILAMVKAVKP